LQYNSKNPSLHREFKKYIDMDIPHLSQQIERNFRWRDKSEMLWDLDDTFLPWIRRLLQKITKQSSIETSNPNQRYAFMDIFITARLQEYASEVSWVLCHLEKLCENLDTFSDLPFENQVDTISNIIASHPKLERHRLRVSPMAMAVLIAKIGIAEFCGCYSK
jgi:hypothetical protein